MNDLEEMDGDEPLESEFEQAFKIPYRDLHCKRCLWHWITRKDTDPKSCPKCRSSLWNTLRKRSMTIPARLYNERSENKEIDWAEEL